MKLSEAIRLGIGAVTEARGYFFDDSKGYPCGCALSTGLYAVGQRGMETDAIRRTMTVWPWTATMTHCPAEDRCFHSTRSVAGTISHVHCWHRWTRERIADWVATLEPQETDHEAFDRQQGTVDEPVVQRPM